jgi:SAM-dependent methyltransferase
MLIDLRQEPKPQTTAGSRLEPMRCPVCGAESGCPGIERWGGYTLRHCRQCQVVFADPMDSAGAGFYEDPAGHGCSCLQEIYGQRKVVRKGWESLSQNGRLLLKRKPTCGGSLLDIGCGEGLFLHFAKRHYSVTGIDLDRDAVQTARQMYGVDRVYAMSLREFSRTFAGRRYDVITMFDVLEHLDDPSGHLAMVRDMLADDGVLVISLPNRDRKSFSADMHSLADYPPNHMTRWNAAALKTLVTRLGFEIVTLYSRRSDLYGLYESGDILRYRFRTVINPLMRLLQRKRRIPSEDGGTHLFYEDSPVSRAFKIALRSVSSLLWFPLWLPFRLSRQASYGIWLMARRSTQPR